MRTPLRERADLLKGTVVGFAIDLVRFGGRKLLADRAPLMAAALSYRTIFSLIPVLVLSLVIFKAFLGEDDMRRGLRDLLDYTGISRIQLSHSPEAEQAEAGLVGPPIEASRLAETIERFVDKTVERIQKINFGLIAVVGVLLLIYAALSLVIQVEQAFNTVCRAPSGRRLSSRLVTYYALLTLGPFALVGGFLLSNATARWAADVSAWAAAPMTILSRYGITWLVLVLAYTWMPNTRIRLGAAAIGAVIAAVLWEGAKSALAGFVAFITNPESGGQMTIYGSIALLPLLLLWVYVTWLIVLFGLEVTFAFQAVASGQHRLLERQTEKPIIDPAMGVLLLNAAAERFAQGKPATGEELARRTGLTEAAADRVLRHLVSKSFMHRVEGEGDVDVPSYTLARPPETISAGEVLESMLELASEPPADGQAAAVDSTVLQMLRRSQVEALRTLRLDKIRGGAAS